MSTTPHPTSLITTPPNWLPYYNVTGMDQSIISWAALTHRNSPNEVLHLSLVGQHVRLRAFWAAFMNKSGLTLKLRGDSRYYDVAAKRISGSGIYTTTWSGELPTTGMHHLDITHISTHTQRPDMCNALHLRPQGQGPDYALLMRQLNRMLVLPFLDEWAPRLWEYGLATKVIMELPSFGCTAHRIVRDEKRWTRIVVACVLGKAPEKITSDTVHFEMHGQSHTKDDTVTVYDTPDEGAEDDDAE